MTRSQRALAAALAILVLVILAAMIWLRSRMSSLEVSGERATLTPSVSEFDAVSVRGGWRLDLGRGDSWRVELEVPAEIEDRLEVRVANGVLEIGVEEGLWLGGLGRGDLVARMTLPRLDSVTVAGASEIDLRGFEGERLAITSSGAVDIEGHSSRYGVLDLTMSGAGQADLRDVVVTDANVALTGAADVTLRMAGGRLAGRIAGAGKVAYYGTVSEQSIATSGIGTVERVD